MKSMIKTALTALAFTTLLCTATPAAPTAAAPKQNKLATELSLSADQQTKLAAINKEFSATSKVTRNQLKAKKEELKTLKKNGAAKPALDAKSKEISAIKAKRDTDRNAKLAKIKAILTPAQYQKYLDHKEAKKKNKSKKSKK